jgi:hypothetical protein
MKFANKILITTSIVLFKNVRVFSQGTYDWKEHSEAMDKINWNDAISGWFFLFVIIGIFYLLYNGLKKNNIQTIDPNNTKKDIYVGEEKHGKKNGKGKMTYANGTIYDGLWKNDKRHGKGIYTSSVGYRYGGSLSKFIGEWKDGKKHGKGIEYKGYRIQDGGSDYFDHWEIGGMEVEFKDGEFLGFWRDGKYVKNPFG